MKTRTEYDSMGAVDVPAEHHWGAQTQRSLENFRIGTQKQPLSIIKAFAQLKAACAKANFELGRLNREQAEAICSVCGEIADGKWHQYLWCRIQRRSPRPYKHCGKHRRQWEDEGDA